MNNLHPEPDVWVSANAGDRWQPVSYEFLGIDLLMAPLISEQFLLSSYTGCEPRLCQSLNDEKSWNSIEGVPRFEILAAESDGERSIISLGASEKLVYSAGGQTMLPNTSVPGRGSFDVGVYRLANPYLTIGFIDR